MILLSEELLGKKQTLGIDVSHKTMMLLFLPFCPSLEALKYGNVHANLY